MATSTIFFDFFEIIATWILTSFTQLVAHSLGIASSKWEIHPRKYEIRAHILKDQTSWRNNYAKKIYEQMENEEVDGEINDEELVLKLLKFSTLPLLCMTEDLQKDIKFERRVVEINGMVIAWGVYDVCDKEIVLDALKYPMGLRILSSTWRNAEKTAFCAILFYLEKNFYTDYDCFKLRNRMVKIN